MNVRSKLLQERSLANAGFTRYQRDTTPCPDGCVQPVGQVGQALFAFEQLH